MSQKMMLFHLEYFILSNYIYLFIAYAHMCVYSHATAHMYRSGNNLQEWLLSFHCVDPWN